MATSTTTPITNVGLSSPGVTVKALVQIATRSDRLSPRYAAWIEQQDFLGFPRAEILKKNLPFSISEIEEACPGISRDMVRVILRTMKAEGLIAPTGKGRSAKWEKVQPPTGQPNSSGTRS